MPLNEYDDMILSGKPREGNAYDDMLTADREVDKNGLQRSHFVASTTEPDRRAKAIELSRKTKLPVEMVERNFDEVSKRATKTATDYDAMLDKSPGLAKFLQDGENASVAHDDTESLSRVEQGARLIYRKPEDSLTGMPAAFGRSAMTGWNNLNASAWHLAAAYGMTSPQEAAEAVAAANKRAADLKARMPDYATDFSRVMEEEAGDVDKAFRRFTGGWAEMKRGNVMKALADYSVGGIKTVGETLDMIRSAVIRPRGLAYSTVESLAHSLPSLITGIAAAKGGAALGGAAGTVVAPGPGTAIGLGVGGALGFGTGTFVGSVPVEVGSWINESLQKRGFDLTDPQDILRAYSDPTLMTEVRSEAERKGLTTATVDAVFSAFAGRLVKGAKPGMASKAVRAAGDVAVQAVGEGASEFAGQVAAAKGDASKASLGEAIQEGLSSLGHSAGETVAGATVAGAGKARSKFSKDTSQAAEQVASGTDDAVRAQHDAQALQEVGNAVKDSKLAKRLPDKLRNLVEVATEGQEATSVFFQAADWDEYWQAQGLSPAQASAQILGDDAKSYFEAKAAGSQIEIPLGVYVEKIATSEHFDGLLQSARTRVDGMSLKEAQTFLQELPGVMDDLAKEATATTEEVKAVDSAAQVGTTITERLKAVGFDEPTANTYAKVYESAFKALGERAGIDPKELFDRYGLQINRQEGTAADPGSLQQPTDPASSPFPEGQPVPGQQGAPGMPDPQQAQQGIVPSGSASRIFPTPSTYLRGQPFDPSIAVNPDFIKLSNDAAVVVENYAKTRGETATSEFADKLWREFHDAFGEFRLNPESRAAIRSKYPDLANEWLTLNAKKFADNTQGYFERAVAGHYGSFRPQSARALDAPAAPKVDASKTGPARAEFHAWQVTPPEFGPSFPLYNVRGEHRLTGSTVGVDTLKREGIALPETPSMEDWQKGDGKTFQQDARGQIRFGDDRKFNIDLLKNADLSTFLHETGHFYLEVLGDLSQTADANQQVKDDYAAILKWFGVDAREGIKTEHHEQFARGFEAYLMEGKAPTSELRAAFYRFRAWLISIYKQITSLRVDLTPEVRGVFDRLLATQDQIGQAQAEQNVLPLFADPKAAGMTDAEAESYAKAVAEAKQAAEEELSAKVMGQWQRQMKAWWTEQRDKVRSEVAEEVGQRKEYLALSVLQAREGAQLPLNMQPFKLSKEAIQKDFPDFDIKNLPRPYVYAKEGGLHPDQAAEIFGFKSGSELLFNIENAEKRDVVIDRLTDQRMRETYGDLLTDGQMPVEAVKAVHNEKRAQLLHKELKHLASNNLPALKTAVRRMSRRVPPVQAVRDQAVKIIGTKLVRDIRPGIYQRAELQAGKEAIEAMLKGDFDAAFQAKQRELLNHELFRAAVAAEEEAKKIVVYASKFNKPAVRERLGKAGQSYLEQVDSIMERFDFRRSIALTAVDKRTSLLKWLEEQRAMGFNPEIPDQVLNEANRTHYKNLPFEQLVGVGDTLKNIESMAKLKNQLLKAGRMRELDAAVDEAVASIVANSKGEKPREVETRLPQDEFSKGLVGFLASHRKFASIARQMDGFQDNGVMWDLFVRPMNEAGNREAVMNEAATTALNDIFKVYGVKDIAKTMYRRQHIPEIGRGLTKMGQIMVALNWGNLDNRQKLMDGQGWSEDQVKAILARLDERDWKVVQQVWDYIDTFWPETKAVSERVNGVAPSKVEAAPIETPFGTMRGGYFPLKYDDRQAPKAYSNLAKEAAERAMRGASIRSTTAHGHREERVQGVKMPIRLDFGVVFEHVAQVIHDQTHYEFLIDMNRLLGHKGMQDAIISHHGNEAYAQMRDTLRDVAAGDVPSQSAFEKGINWLRTGTSIATMGWNVMTSLVQPLGLTQSVVRIGPKYVASGIKRWLGDAARMENTVAWIHEKSDMMRLRGKTQLREINEVRNSLRLRGQVLGAMEDSYFWLITRGQMIADVPTWLGAYEKAFDTDPAMDEKTAVALADQAVLDSQGGGQVKDLADIQRGGPLKKLWTNFYSYFNTTYNQAAEAIGRTNYRSPAEVGRLAVDLLMLYSVPAMLGLALKEALRGGDDDDEWAEKAFREQAAYILGSLVGLREISGAVQGFQGYEGPAGSRAFSEVGKLFKQVSQGEVDEALIKSLNKTAGILFHYPATQVERTIRGLAAIFDGDTDNPAAVLVGPKRE